MLVTLCISFSTKTLLFLWWLRAPLAPPFFQNESFVGLVSCRDVVVSDEVAGVELICKCNVDAWFKLALI